MLKQLLLVLICSFYAIGGYAQKQDSLNKQLILCSESGFKCHIINYLPSGPDQSPRWACCSDIQLTSDWDCVDDCVFAKAPREGLTNSTSEIRINHHDLIIDGEVVGQLNDVPDALPDNYLVQGSSLLLKFSPNELMSRQVLLQGNDLILDGELIGTFPTLAANSKLTISTVSHTDKKFNPFEKVEQVRLFPNPTSDILNVSLSVKIDRILIYDASGMEMKNINLSRDSKEKAVDVSLFPIGTYTVILSGSEENFIKSFVKR